MILSQVIAALDKIAPPEYAQPWDNVGLLVGDAQQNISRAILTIDLTRAVADEAIAQKCELIVAYHPPIFEALKTITTDGKSKIIFDLIQKGIAIYSPHTSIDAAPGGTCDMLADVIGMSSERSPLKMLESKESNFKLVTFVPKDALQTVSDAIFAAGAGSLGNYDLCSFRSSGVGTFRGDENTHPTIGEPGKLEAVEEIRFETILRPRVLAAVVTALRNSHPYEEPAFDLISLTPEPASIGIGRIGEISPLRREKLFGQIKSQLGLEHLLIAGPVEGIVNRAAVCPGSCGDLLDDALAQHAQLYLTGEMRHHDALRAAAAGMTVVCTLHSNSERAMLTRLAERLKSEVPELATVQSQQDRDPFSIL